MEEINIKNKYRMTSVQRTFAQRTTAVQELAPYGTNTTSTTFIDLVIDPVNTTVFNVDVRNVTPWNRGSDDNLQLFNIVYDQTIAAKYPGLEFTLFFDSYKGTLPTGTKVSIKTPDQQDAIESHYPFSVVSGSIVQVLSVTLKSNGRVFNVVSGGPSYWT